MLSRSSLRAVQCLALLALLAFGALLVGAPVFGSLANLFLLGIFAFSFIGNVLR